MGVSLSGTGGGTVGRMDRLILGRAARTGAVAAIDAVDAVDAVDAEDASDAAAESSSADRLLGGGGSG